MLNEKVSLSLATLVIAGLALKTELERAACREKDSSHVCHADKAPTHSHIILQVQRLELRSSAYTTDALTLDLVSLTSACVVQFSDTVQPLCLKMKVRILLRRLKC